MTSRYSALVALLKKAPEVPDDLRVGKRVIFHAPDERVTVRRQPRSIREWMKQRRRA